MTRPLELSLRRSPLDPWLGVVLRVGAMSGCGLGVGLAGVVLAVGAIALGISSLAYLAVAGLCAVSVPMMVLPLFALLFLQLGGRRLSVGAGEVVLRRTDGSELSRASVEAVRSSVRKGVYDAWGRRGLVLHLGVGSRPIAIGALDPEAARASHWPPAAPPDLECSPQELDALMRAIGLEPPRES